MEIIVLGAGAIGSLYGAKLAATNDVTLVGRAVHVAAIESNGLRLEGLESATVRIRAVTAINAVGPDALVLLTTKVPDSAAAISSIAPFVRDDTTILCLQNGLGSEEIVRGVLQGRGVVLRGVTKLGAIFKKSGVIRFMAPGCTTIERHERSGRISRSFEEAGFDCEISAKIGADIWHKVVINCVVNPITTILGAEVGRIADPQLDPLKGLVIDECLAVAATQGITFDIDFIRTIDELFRPSLNINSMLQDIRRGRATEIDYLNGAVAALGARYGIECPVNAALTAIIKAMETASLVPKKMFEPEPG